MKSETVCAMPMGEAESPPVSRAFLQRAEPTVELASFRKDFDSDHDDVRIFRWRSIGAHFLHHLCSSEGRRTQTGANRENREIEPRSLCSLRYLLFKMSLKVTYDISRLILPRLARQQIREDEPVALDDHAAHDFDRCGEHPAGVREGVELAALAAGIARSRELGEERVAEFASGEARIEHARIDACQPRPQTAGDHRAGQRRRVTSPERETHREPARRELALTVGTDVFQEEV